MLWMTYGIKTGHKAEVYRNKQETGKERTHF